MELNPRFLERMEQLLGKDYPQYLKFVGLPPFRGLRVNTLKADFDKVEPYIDTELTPSVFCENVYHIPADAPALGNHPLHHCGAFYLGDPSATSAVAALDPQPGDTVLDLCASPGGKTVGIAAALGGEGFIVANETVSSRIQPLLSNIERMGIGNIAVTNARPDDLCPALAGVFNKVLVDAPCSGEGMMLRDGQANINWSEKNIEASAERQRKILESAAVCVAPGGVLVYSTCTFAPEENEQNVADFLSRHPDFYMDDIPREFGIDAFGHLCENGEVSRARRIFPMQGGDGHFVARLRRKGNYSPTLFPAPKGKNKVFEEFWSANFEGDIPPYSVFADKVFICKYDMSHLPGIVRQGVFAGYIKGNRFEPSHSLYCAVGFSPKRAVDFAPDSPVLTDFMKGLEIPCEHSGYTAVTVCGMPFSFGKASGDRLKNHYPKGLRLL